MLFKKHTWLALRHVTKSFWTVFWLFSIIYLWSTVYSLVFYMKWESYISQMCHKRSRNITIVLIVKSGVQNKLWWASDLELLWLQNYIKKCVLYANVLSRAFSTSVQMLIENPYISGKINVCDPISPVNKRYFRLRWALMGKYISWESSKCILFEIWSRIESCPILTPSTPNYC